MADTWTHLVRFYHHAIPTFGQLVDKFDGGELPDTFKVKVATGEPVNETIKYTGEIVEVVKEDLLAPVANVPIVINTGLNYRDHIEESQFSVPVHDLNRLASTMKLTTHRISQLPFHTFSTARRSQLLHRSRRRIRSTRCNKNVSTTKASWCSRPAAFP
jgi:2-keto-4-pentenoate hydratase/2-oxohepta-3-ene-1,7-dioic acid hydratase in catechol pathway